MIFSIDKYINYIFVSQIDKYNYIHVLFELITRSLININFIFYYIYVYDVIIRLGFHIHFIH